MNEKYWKKRLKQTMRAYLPQARMIADDAIANGEIPESYREKCVWDSAFRAALNTLGAHRFYFLYR